MELGERGDQQTAAGKFVRVHGNEARAGVERGPAVGGQRHPAERRIAQGLGAEVGHRISVRIRLGARRPVRGPRRAGRDRAHPRNDPAAGSQHRAGGEVLFVAAPGGIGQQGRCRAELHHRSHGFRERLHPGVDRGGELACGIAAHRIGEVSPAYTVEAGAVEALGFHSELARLVDQPED
ncbi:MAG: hypothetical protein F4046_04225 [Acidimicrobiaceae bacterium]|nr:hypothetical protein [Acidimicrobiaceae bacterium]